MTELSNLNVECSPSMAANLPLVRWLDWAAFGLFFLAVALPFPQIVTVPLGIITSNAFEFLYLAAGALLCLKIVVQAEVQFPTYSLGTLFAFAAYFIGSLALSKTNFGDPIGQMRFYFPFFLSIIWLMAGTRVTASEFFRWLLAASIVSAASALILYHLYPSYVEGLISHSGDSTHVLEAGRLFWSNAAVTFFVLFYFAVRDEYTRSASWLAWLALLVCLAGTFNTVQRTLLFGLVLFLVGTIFAAKGRHEAFRRVGLLVSIALLLCVVVAAYFVLDQKVGEMVFVRFLGSGGGIARIYQIDLLLGRVTLYRQYWESLHNYFPLGQGFGRPYSVLLGKDVLVTDISIMSFLLPMGIIGVAIFAAFLRKLWFLAARTALPLKYTRNLRLLILVGLAVSLNVDVFSRNNFVVALTLLALTFGNSGAMRRQTAGVPSV